ncbi:MAG TPA: prephenate dehydrogenase [Phycisphaerae bacterium]|nr:prephenate dehydrogenase [Phycisphaerae bacterium]
MARLNHVTIIGVGLLGGSIGLALKKLRPRVRVAGVGRRRSSLARAMRAGAIDSAHLDAGEAVGQSDLVILATPVGAFAGHLSAIRPHLKAGAMVTDVGSTKVEVVRAARRILGPRELFVGSHPMAGSERKGVQFARADLFRGAVCVVTPTPSTPRGLAARAERLWRMLGMRTVRMSPAAHDKAMANVSHLPHVAASVLMTVPGRADLSVAGPGLRDTTRLASGDPEMWRDIMLSNRKAILAALNRFGRSMGTLRRLLAKADAKGIERFLTAVKKRRDTTIGADNG